MKPTPPALALLILALALLVTACDEAPAQAYAFATPPPAASDPIIQAEFAKATGVVANAFIAATEAENQRVMAVYTAQANQDRYQVELDLTRIMGASQGTQAALVGVQTQAAVTQAAIAQEQALLRATEAVNAKETQWAIAAPGLSATQGALYRKQETDRINIERARRVDGIEPFFWALMVLMLVASPCLALLRWTDWRIEEARRKSADKTIIVTPKGKVICYSYDPDYRDFRWQVTEDEETIDAEAVKALPTPRRAPVYYRTSPGGVFATSPLHSAQHDRALQLIKDAIQVNGGKSNVIPGWRGLPGYWSDSWSAAVRELKEMGVVFTIQKKETRLEGEGNTLEALLWHLEASPPPREVGAD